MSTLATTYSFTADTTIFSAEVNQNFSDISLWANGNIGADNLATLTAVVDWSISGSDRGIRITSSASSPSIEITNTGTGIPFKITDSNATGSSPVFQVISTTRGTMPFPVMTTTQKNAITSPPTGLSVFDSTLNLLSWYTGAAWNSPASLTGTETLTNKTLTSPTITGATLSTSTLTTPTINGVKIAVSTSTTITAAQSFVEIDASGGAATATLPTAATGQEIQVRKSDSTFNSVTINNSAAAAQTTLNTQGETVALVYNGTSWVVTRRYIPGAWTSVTMALSNSTNNTTVAFMKRVGDSAIFDIRAAYTGANTQGGVDWALPTGLTIDTSKMTTLNSSSALNRFGIGVIAIGGGRNYVGALGYNTTNNFRVSVIQGNVTSNDYTLMNTNTNVPAAITNASFLQFTTVPIPITGWNG